MDQNTSCTVAILTYKGMTHLQYLLPTLKEAIDASPDFKVEVLIIDNGCDTETRDFVNSNYSGFRYEFSPVNDYLFSYNRFINQCTSDYVFILNDDVRLDKNIFNQSIPLLVNDSSLFAVSSTLMDWEGKELQEAVRTISFKNGWMYIHNQPLAKDIRYTFNACGGASICRTKMFNDLEGFDRLFYPAYYEDTDLSHRAWHKGWKIVNNPNAIVYHRAGGSWGDENKKKSVEILQQKNKIVGMLKNSDYKNFRLLFWLFFPVRSFKSVFNSQTQFKAMLYFLFNYFKMRSSFKRKIKSTISDKELLKRLNTSYSTK